ncbi:hypothetical protein [Bradyrhizobium sp. BR 10289]|uniref:DUF6894 family protein n=1 Tax=Bradyrhizobium sp. BR 10289 TaxID=2749993 RepID=UPI001C64ED4E|nr:hypothetical protein [Bradyrhizobium sp. BR 10289]MBW7971125.1 hypothetical protein [Bradyrhizobium sp. BR 10289]
MPTYFFDQHIGSEIDVDTDGTDLLDLGTARRASLELLGEAIILERARFPFGELSIVVRDEKGPVLRVSANVVTEELAPSQPTAKKPASRAS